MLVLHCSKFDTPVYGEKREQYDIAKTVSDKPYLNISEKESNHYGNISYANVSRPLLTPRNFGYMDLHLNFILFLSCLE